MMKCASRTLGAARAETFTVLLPAMLAGALCLLSWAPLDLQADARILQEETRTKVFDDVIFDLEFAITQRNFRITARNDIGRGIRQRGFKDFPQVIIIHFCNLTLARKALEIDPNFINHMPCRIAVYDHGDRITVSAMSLPEDSGDPNIDAFSRRVNVVLRGILSFAAE